MGPARGRPGPVGITDYAQDALGDVVFVQLPEVGADRRPPAHRFSEVESTKSVSDIYAPVAGTVVEVNADLVDAPERLNDDPYGDGLDLRHRAGRSRRPTTASSTPRPTAALIEE